LVTIVGNLVDNAFDVLSGMTVEDGQRRVEVAGETIGDTVQITVTDSGPGLTPSRPDRFQARLVDQDGSRPGG
jgi:sensor histidine kinase regulating citrate/malate metabolism